MRRPRHNPFSPDLPVPPALFAGRKKALATIEAGIDSLLSGRPKHLLIVSEPWLGKSSLAFRAKRMAHNLGAGAPLQMGRFAMCKPVFCSMGACSSLPQVCTTIMNSVLRGVGAPIGSSISRLLKRVKGLRMGPLGIDFESARQAGASVVSEFPHLLEDILTGVGGCVEERSSVLLILDEVQNIAAIQGLASHIKTTLEYLSERSHTNLALVITANPADLVTLSRQVDSFAGMFSTISIGRITDAEVQELLTETACRGRPSRAFTDDAIAYMVELAAGYPGFVQQIGHAAFDLASGPLIDLRAVKKALVGGDRMKGAVDSIADKHFRHLLDLEPIYSRILDAIDLAETPLTSADIRSRLPEIRNLGPYIKKLLNRNAITRLGTRSRPEYAIAAPIVSLWLHLQRTLPQSQLPDRCRPASAALPRM
ncbi:MAG: hypothetical protein JW941_12615 [Candidatus Coatesbacteria bacterium]|nr:hypothetical protein [Candidatus Coatesbacteria bacterium]